MKLTRKGFRAWLASKKPRQIVGQYANCASCPIASYLLENGCEEVEVDGFAAICVTKTGTSTIKLPTWARLFIRRLDVHGARGSGVTAATCLRILDKIP